MQNIAKSFTRFIGLGANRSSHREKIISGLGGLVSILLILLVSRQLVGANDAGLIVASMGASAVLLFAVPHGPLSQPWALCGGHMISAFIGVSCYLLIPDLFIAAAVAVGLSITVMYYMRCIHPPGGATALTAVVAGPAVHDMGYQFLVTPVLLNVLIIFSVALAFNYLFAWRRYPIAIMHYARTESAADKPREDSLNRDDLEHALQQMNLYVDVSHEDLERIYQLARNRISSDVVAEQIKLGKYYSNGEYGSNWSVRRVVDEADNPRPGKDQIIYKVVAGKGRRSSGVCSREEFSQWAKYEVYLNENSWQRVATSVDVANAA